MNNSEANNKAAQLIYHDNNMASNSIGENETPRPADLRTILQETIEAPVSAEHPSNDQYLKLQRLLLQESASLAKQLFELTNNIRETKLEVYLKTINDVVLARPSKENQFILKNTQRIFTETYGEYIKHLGHDPDLLEQIVHRVGKESKEILAKTLIGFDATELAEQVRAYALTAPDQASKTIARLMYDLTHQQVRELRYEYNSLPARELARLIHTLLLRKDLRNRPFPDRLMLKYILQYRTRKELAQVEFQYNELYHFIYEGEREPCLREQIKACLDTSAAAELLTMLDGFDPNPIALAIYECLQNSTSFIEGLDNLGTNKLANDFAVQFRRSNDNALIWQKELALQPMISNLVSKLNISQYRQVTEVLKSKYDIELSNQLYTNISNFDPRKSALNLYLSCNNSEACASYRKDEQYLSDYEIANVKDEFRFSKQSDLHDIIKVTATEKKATEALRRALLALEPLLMLDRVQIEKVSKSFFSLYGIKLIDFVHSTVERICNKKQLPYVFETITLLLAGIARQPVKVDIFELFSSKIKRSQDDDKAELTNEIMSALPKIANIIDQIEFDQNKIAELIDLITSINLPARLMLEDLCSSAKKDACPFLQGVKNFLPQHSYIHIEQLFKGLDITDIVKKIHEHPELAINYLHLDIQDACSVLEFYENTYGVTFLSHISSQAVSIDLKTQAHCQLFAFANQAKELRTYLITTLMGENCEDSALELLISNCNSIELFEASYNFYYGNFAPAFEQNNGALLTTLRVLVSAQKTSRLFFSKSVNILERIDKGVTENLYRHVIDANITDEVLDSFKNWLRTYKKDMPVINKSYNALDAECTLRERIYALKRPLLEVNQTLLLFDGFDSVAVATQVEAIMEQSNNSDLAKKLLDLLSLEKDGALNPLIPVDKNWTQEMYHQIRVEYFRNHGRSIIADLVEKKVTLAGHGINAIAHLLYGDASLAALKVFKIINKHDQEPTARMQAIREIIGQLEPVALETLVEFYNDYITALGKGQGVIPDLEKAFGHISGYSELASLFLPATSGTTGTSNS